jgi:predicted enzyme related to lactoylglutathione lyase
MATIVHFDISADDPERAGKFYETLFGWKITWLPGPTNYYLAETKDLKGNPGVGGGIAKRESGQQASITNFIGVTSINETIDQVTKCGGKVIQKKQPVPGWGHIAVCTDTENNIFGLFEEDKNAK